MRLKTLWPWLAACIVCVVVASSANADTVYTTSFALVSKEPEYADIGDQFKVTLANEIIAGESVISFTFTNDSVISSSIHEIYFYDGHLFGKKPTAVVSSSLGVQYQAQHVAPSDFKGNFPEGLSSTSAVRFYATDSNSGGKGLAGLNAAGEWLKVSFKPLAGVTLDEVFGDLVHPYQSPQTAGYTDSPFFIGMHVGNLPGGKSDWYGTEPNPPVVVPLPTAVLGGMVLLAGCAVQKRFKVR